MDRRRKVELFEQIRREFEFGVGASVKSVAKKFGVHRRMVRQAIAAADPRALVNNVVFDILTRHSRIGIETWH